MSINPSPELKSLFETALNEFEKRVGTTLDQHPIIDKLVNCESAESVIDVLQEQAQAFRSFRGGDGKLFTWLKRTVNVLYALSTSDVISGAISSPFSLANAIFAGIAILLGTIKDFTSTSYDALVELFESFESFLRRLDIYTKIPSTPAMTEIIVKILVKILVELLSTISLAIQQAKQGRLKTLGKKLLGENDVEAMLQRLDRLTRDEAQTTATQTLELVYGLVKNIRVVMDGGSVLMDDVHQTLVLIQQLTSDMNKSRRDQMQENFRRWLSPPDPSKNYDIARKAHHEGSVKWFVHGDMFYEWKRATGSLLWIHGKPGSGKSVLSSAIIKEIMRMSEAGLASIAFFYFDFRESSKQDVRGALSSLLTQLSAQSDAWCGVLEQLYSAHHAVSKVPSEDALRGCLKNMLMLEDQGPMFIVLDAIDECPNSAGTPSPRENILELVEWLSELHYSHISICVTSRPEADIEAVLQPLASRTVSLHGEIGQTQDIVSYIKWFLNSDPRARKWRKENKDLVLERLSKGGGGMFRWVFCQLDRLRRCLLPPIRQALNGLIETLDEIYERTLLDIGEENWAYAHRLFQCIVVARRPLRVEELAEFLAFKSDTGGSLTFQRDWRPENPRDTVLSICSSLISIVNVDGSAVIQFSHSSVKEYLTSSRIAEGRVSRYHIALEPAHIFVTQACLSVLLELDDHVTPYGIEELPLAQYAGRHWTEHAEFGDVASHTEDLMKRLFNPEGHHITNWVRIYNTFPLEEQKPLHYAARHGFYRNVEWLITTCSRDANALGYNDWTPFHIASRFGQLVVVQVLLHHADPYAGDRQNWTALHHASWGGHPKIAQLLLEHGADVNSKTEDGETPLRLVSKYNGNVEVAQLLLEHGADPSVRCNYGLDSLYMAILKGHQGLVQMLLKRGVEDPNIRDDNGQTQLHLSSRRGHLEVAQVLLKLGADANSRDNQGRTPLHFALQNGQKNVVKLLLRNGAKKTYSQHRVGRPLYK